MDADIDYVFQNKKDSQPDIEAEINRSRTVVILTGRGSELQRETFSALFLDRSGKKQISVRILLPSTTVPSDQYDWTWQREIELSKFDSSYGKGLLRELIEANAKFCEPHAATKAVSLRRFNCPHIGRIIVTERFAYYTPYRRDAHGRNSKVYKFRSGGEMYDNLLRLFDQLWSAGA